MDQNVKEEGKTMAIVSYITVIGLIIAYFMNKDKNNEFVNFHIGQSLRVFIFAIVLQIVLVILISVTNIGFLSILGLLPLILWVLGVINALGLKETPLPVIGTIGKK